MKIFPAKGLVAAAVVLAVASSGLLFYDGLLTVLGVVTVALVAAAVVDAVLAWRALRQVEATLETPQTVVRGDGIRVEIRLFNNSSHRLRLRVRPVLPDQGVPALAVFDSVLDKQSGRNITLTIQARERGAYHFGDIHLRLRGPLGLIEAQGQFPGGSECRVYPNIRAVKQYIATRRLHDTVAPHLRTARIRGLGSEFESLREYEEGDDIRRIDWKSTARHQRAIVRNFEIEPYRNVIILLDCGRLMTGGVGDATKLDHALDAALMVAGVALDGGDRCGIMLYDSTVRTWLPPRSGLTQLRAIVDHVYDTQPVYAESNFYRPFVHMQTRLAKRSLVLILSDVIDAEASASMVSGVLSLSKRHLVVFAALRTPEIEGVLDKPSTETIDPYRKAVAYRLLEDRTRVMTRLQRSGVQILDVRPDQLTLPLVNKYIELREMNLL